MSACGMRLWEAVSLPYLLARDGLSVLVDRVLGIRTTEPIRSLRSDPDRLRLRPCGWLILLRAFRRLRVDRDDVLIDIGAGRGRAVLLASLFPFRRVVGVERVETLHRQAQRNLVTFRLSPRASVEFIFADALGYTIPPETTVVFLYNPFGGAAFERLIDRIIASVDEVPRRLRVVYVNPREHALTLRSGRWTLTDRLLWPRPTRRWATSLTTHIYEIEPAR